MIKRTKPPHGRTPKPNQKDFIRRARIYNPEWLDEAPWISTETFLLRELVEFVEEVHKNLKLRASYRPTIIGQYEGLKCVLGNLLRCTFLGLPLRVSMDTTGGQRRPFEPKWFIPTIMVPIYKRLEEKGWVNVKLGYRSGESDGKRFEGKTTRLIPTIKLNEFFKQHRLSWWAIETNLFEDREYRMKKLKKGEWKELSEFPHDELSLRGKYQLFDRNQEVKLHKVKFDHKLLKSLMKERNKLRNRVRLRPELGLGFGGGDPELDRNKSEAVDRGVVKLYDSEDLHQYQARMRYDYGLNGELYRVFNRNMSMGGRFYGADHINMPREYRKSLAIDGEPTVELDYRAMHLHLAYAWTGDEPLCPDVDPYDIPPLSRELAKLAVLIMLNAPNRVKAGRGLQYANYRRKVRFPPDMATKDIFARVEEAHPALAPWLYNPYLGLNLQRFESAIMNRVMTELLSLNVVCLPIHDGLIVQERYKDLAHTVMLWVYECLMSDWLKRRYTIQVKEEA